MSIHRSCYCCRYRFSFEVEKSQWFYKRNDVSKILYTVTVYTKCVYTVPVNAVDHHFPLAGKKVTGFIRGMVYTKCVYTVPVTAVDPYIPLTSEKVTGV